MDGLSYSCKKCKGEQTKARRNKLKEDNKNMVKIVESKSCSICRNALPIDKFTKDGTQKDGYSSYCKDCRREKDARLKLEKQDNVKETSITRKLCIHCNVEYDISIFLPSRKSNDGYLNICNNCRPKKTWTKEKQKAAEKKYIENNKDKIRQKWRNQGQKINRRVRDSLNHRISDALTSKNLRKNNKTKELIGCSVEFLKGWIESLFKEGMSWDNYGKWHLDHVKQCCSFDLSDDNQVKQCFWWGNIQPLWAEDNLKKSDTIDESLIYSIKMKAIEYESKFSAQVKEGELREHSKISSTKLDM